MPAARTAKTSAELILTVLQGQSRLGRNCLTDYNFAFAVFQARMER